MQMYTYHMRNPETVLTTATRTTFETRRAVALAADEQYPLPLIPTIISVLRLINSKNFSNSQQQHLQSRHQECRIDQKAGGGLFPGRFWHVTDMRKGRRQTSTGDATASAAPEAVENHATWGILYGGFDLSVDVFQNDADKENGCQHKGSKSDRPHVTTKCCAKCPSQWRCVVPRASPRAPVPVEIGYRA